MNATAAQITYLLRLTGCRFLTDVPGLSRREKTGGLTKARASELIDELTSTDD